LLHALAVESALEASALVYHNMLSHATLVLSGFVSYFFTPSFNSPKIMNCVHFVLKSKCF